ncbi:ATX1 antioxidant protein 1 [Rhizopus stolonifer]|uniref:ATX1 antioxidant protein 1 n=1 Tax=Rhizopus stolonifer TaxID=4846 RepID=A0A367J5N6_RHIST|nr:ATX1 antioxidant protein 1 [Rhizopus stolonifer]
MATYTFNVEMSCSGCSNAVERALKRLGVESVQTDLEKQEVIVVSEHSLEEVLATIQKTGKTVSVKN